MKSISKAAVGGLLWLTFSAFAFGDTITFTGIPNEVEGGGQFTATLASDPGQTLYVYCVDFNNDLTFDVPYTVNDTNLLAGPITNTRYGTTPISGFTTQTTPPSDGTPTDRYAMAAYLITQYNFTMGVTAADYQIQNAIWTLLDATGNTFTSNGGVGNYLTQAETWFQTLSANPSALAAFESEVTIYSSTSIAGSSIPGRYGPDFGNQEMIGIAPEPQSLALLGAGLLALGLFRKRVKA